MRIDYLELLAFGPFSGRVLSFGDAPMVLVHGANEAGKSAALRALGDWLFGIPARSTDDFMHKKADLRIAGRLVADDGRALVFTRRKGNKNTLLDDHGEPLPENALAPFLHGIDRKLFESLFGIDHERLVAGGREMLEQRGDVGQALFSAALGGRALHRLRERLEEEADALFLRRGSKPRLNQALKEYQALRKSIREQALSGEEWRAVRTALDEAERQRAEIDADLNRLRGEQRRLQRILAALPKLARQQELRERLARLGEVVTLGADFAERHARARKQLSEAETALAEIDAELRDASEQLKQIDPHPRLLEQAERIEALHAEIGACRKAARDRPGLAARHQRSEAEAEQMLAAIRPGLTLAQAEPLRAWIERAPRVEELGTQYARLSERRERAQEQLEESRRQLEECERELAGLAPPAPIEPLREAITAARRHGELERRIDDLEQDYARRQRDWETALARLRPAPDTKALTTLAVPDSATIERFAHEFDRLDQKRQRLEEAIVKWDEQRLDARRELDALQRDGELPDQERLEQARARRDRLWRALLRHWRDGQAFEIDIAPETDPEAAFEARLREADALADRRYLEADRLRQGASLAATINDCEQRLNDARKEQAGLEESRKNTVQAWREAWRETGIEPQTPAEMRAWLGAFGELRRERLQLDALEHERAALIQQHDAAVETLRAAMRDSGASADETSGLEALLSRAEGHAQALEARIQQRRALETRRDELGKALARAEAAQSRVDQALAQWREQWSDLASGLGLSEDAVPAEANARIESVRAMFQARDQAAGYRERLDGIEADARHFAKEVEALVATLAPELAGQDPIEAASRLHQRLAKARDLASRCDEIEEQLKRAKGRRAKTEARRKRAREQLAGLCREAGVEEIAALDEAERRDAEWRAINQELDRLEQELRELGDGRSSEQLAREAEGHEDGDQVRARLDELERKLADLEAGRDQLGEKIGRLRTELEAMEGGEGAAGLAEEAASRLAAIRADVERYTCLCLARQQLGERVEAYRRAHQGPLLERASAHFARLTLGGFARLEADIDRDDRPVLIGVRANGQRVGVDGMSAGTRDQLYLALRLASLEYFLRERESLPFIVDDVLVEFDDERAMAALETLAELSQKTQVILFSHHQRLVEQARALEAGIQIMALGNDQ